MELGYLPLTTSNLQSNYNYSYDFGNATGVNWPIITGQSVQTAYEFQLVLMQAQMQTVTQMQVAATVGVYGNCGNAYANYVYYDNFVETEEQRTARFEVEAQAEKKRIAAESRAEELLFMCLTDEQRAQYINHGYLEVNVDSRKYRIKKGWSKNIEELDAEGKPKTIFCVHPSLSVPNADCVLAQKLLLETNEAEFLRLANKWAV